MGKTTTTRRPAMRAGAAGQADSHERKASLAAAGSLLGALGVVSCCILPLALLSLGAGGAWIGKLAALAPYQPILVAVTAGLLAAGFYQAYRKPKADCADVSCTRPASRRLVKICLWTATVLVVLAVAFTYAEPMILRLLWG